MSQRGHKDS